MDIFKYGSASEISGPTLLCQNYGPYQPIHVSFAKVNGRSFICCLSGIVKFHDLSSVSPYNILFVLIAEDFLQQL